MEIIEQAPARVNLGLGILHRRMDDCREVESIFTSVGLANRSAFKSLEEDIIRIGTDSPLLPMDRRNRVYQAVDLLGRTYNIHRGIKIYIEKHIPVVADLTGGSGDRTTVLRGLNKLQNLGLTIDELCEISSQIGVDVPYCLRDGTALIDGRGERIEALPTMSRCWIVLVKPRISVSTSTTFNDLAIDRLHHSDIAGLRIAIENDDYTRMAQTVGNVLGSIMIARHPIMQQVKDRVPKYDVDIALVSGDKPAAFALCKKKARAQRIHNGLKGSCGEVYLARILR